jgi:hypothetical protein
VHQLKAQIKVKEMFRLIPFEVYCCQMTTLKIKCIKILLIKRQTCLRDGEFFEPWPKNFFHSFAISDGRAKVGYSIREIGLPNSEILDPPLILAKGCK